MAPPVARKEKQLCVAPGRIANTIGFIPNIVCNLPPVIRKLNNPIQPAQNTSNFIRISVGIQMGRDGLIPHALPS